MPVTRTVLRGVQNIRTMSGRVDDKAIPYKAYMKLSVLEMEKYRRGKEKATALARVQTIEQRFQEIEVEKQQMLQEMAAQGVARPESSRSTGRPASSAAAPAVGAPRSSTGAFKIRY